MNRPRRPAQMPQRRRPSGPPSGSGPNTGGPPRRRSPLDLVPATVEPKFQVLGTGMDRQMIQQSAQPMEMVVIQGWTQEIEQEFQKAHLRPDDFWAKNPKLLETARKLDGMLAQIQGRRNQR